MTEERRRIDLVIDAAEALWGPRCQAGLGRALEVNPSTLHRWSKGLSAPGPEASAVLYPLVEQRIEILQRLSNELRRDSQSYPLDSLSSELRRDAPPVA